LTGLLAAEAFVQVSVGCSNRSNPRDRQAGSSTTRDDEPFDEDSLTFAAHAEGVVLHHRELLMTPPERIVAARARYSGPSAGRSDVSAARRSEELE